MIGVECVTSFDKLIHELNDFDSVRRAPGLLALVDGNGADSTAPHGSVLFAVFFFTEAFLKDLTPDPCRALDLRRTAWQRPVLWALGSGRMRSSVCARACAHARPWPSTSKWLSLYMLKSISEAGGALQNLLGHIVVWERTAKPSNRSRKTKNCPGYSQDAFLVYYRDCHLVGLKCVQWPWHCLRPRHLMQILPVAQLHSLRQLGDGEAQRRKVVVMCQGEVEQGPQAKLLCSLCSTHPISGKGTALLKWRPLGQELGVFWVWFLF